ncbi:hypothetical protein J1N51_08140 [Psychrosphaera ytuae]|uniref:Lipoprotein n=1 Tax=Psychrosphaera ytuae TaxID=2820710 RepID=A0A975D9F5_9GAMM|nr:hypothetical protein [Psychrosphaera ytuae]QTH62749.1 hypothetical protein J1N51_08140 [Psychrosphaera ytuae]
MLESKSLLKAVVSMSCVFVLVACGARTPEPYQKDRAPEARDQYTGNKGLQQKLKDEQAIAKKKQNERCEEAQFRWMEAQAADDQAAIALAKRNVDKHCAKN